MQKIRACGLFFIVTACFFLPDLFAAEDSRLDLQPIVISKPKARFLSLYSVKADSLKYLPVNSSLEAIGLLPVDLQSRSPKGGIQADFSLRGSTFQGVSLLLDGQRINDPQTGHHNCDIPLTGEDIEKIELLPGAINIIRKKPQDKKRVLELRVGQYRTKSGLFSLSERNENLRLRLSLENEESGGFYTDTDYKKFTGTLSSSLEISDAEWNTNFGYQEKEFGAYDFYTPQSGYQSKEWTKTYLLDTGFLLDRDGWLIKPNFLWRRHYDKFILDKTQVRSRYLNYHRTDISTPNIYFQKETDSLGTLGLGLEYAQELINSTNLGKHSRGQQSLFLDEAKDLGEHLSLGLSWRIDDAKGFGLMHTGSLKVEYNICPEKKFHFGVSRNIRIPSFTELYYNDPTTAGNSGLASEDPLAYEVGYGYKKEKLSLGTTFFFRQEDGFIDWIKRSPSQEKWQAENIAEAEVLGIENYLRLNIAQNLSLDTNYSYIDKRTKGHGYLYKYGPNYSRHLGNAVFTLGLPFGQQSLWFNYKKKPGRDGWLLLNARLSYNLRKNSQLFFNATNLMNIEYQEIEGIPQPGRWVEAGLRLEW